MTLFADLVPATNATSGFVPFADRGDHPSLSDYHGDAAGYRSALAAWRDTNVNAPPATRTPAPGGTTPPPATGGTTAHPPTTGSSSALGAFQQFYNSPTYQVPLKAGLEAVNTGYAAKGALESGAAMKAISDYGAGNAAGALGTYMDNLYRQEALGVSASSALAGVGQNLVSNVSANNTNAGNAAANAQLANGQATAGQWNNAGQAIGGALGTIGGALGSSVHPASALAPVNLPSSAPYPTLPGGFY
jgi:hypothetical protein